MIKKKRRENEEKLYDQVHTRNGSERWRIINEMRGKRKERIPMWILNEENKMTKNDEESIVAWKNHFERVGKMEMKYNDEDMIEEESVKTMIEYYEKYNTKITKDEAKKAMRICVANKATGMDKIKNEFIKYGGDEMVEALVMMMNVLWEKERIPDEWLNANIIPIHKADDTHIPNNYRPISLTSVVGKVYEKIIEERITKWLEKRDGIVEEQGGFRTGRGCMDQIWILNEVVQMRREKNKRTYLAFIDFKKAYDVVWRDALFYKIAAMGIRGKMWRVIRDMYREVRNSVLVNGLQSEWWASDKGTRQGSVLSPLLFSIAINDLIHRLKGNRCGVTVEGESIPGLLFADDLVLMAEEEDE